MQSIMLSRGSVRESVKEKRRGKLFHGVHPLRVTASARITDMDNECHEIIISQLQNVRFYKRLLAQKEHEIADIASGIVSFKKVTSIKCDEMK